MARPVGRVGLVLACLSRDAVRPVAVSALNALRHPKRGTINPVAQGGRGFVALLSPLERFRAYCQFDATTGCVLWIGGTTAGRGKTANYGAFWYEGRRWAAHRWAAAHIHGLELAPGVQVDHCCPPHRAGPEPLLPNPLCVQHLQAASNAENTALRDQRRLWLLTQKGYLEAPPLFAELVAPEGVPFHVPPAWLGLDTSVKSADDCPF